MDFYDELAWELAKHWVCLEKKYDPLDYVDFWGGMGRIANRDYLTYMEVTTFDDTQITILRGKIAVIVRNFDSLYKESS